MCEPSGGVIGDGEEIAHIESQTPSCNATGINIVKSSDKSLTTTEQRLDCIDPSTINNVTENDNGCEVQANDDTSCQHEASKNTEPIHIPPTDIVHATSGSAKSPDLEGEVEFSTENETNKHLRTPSNERGETNGVASENSESPSLDNIESRDVTSESECDAGIDMRTKTECNDKIEAGEYINLPSNEREETVEAPFQNNVNSVEEKVESSLLPSSKSDSSPVVTLSLEQKSDITDVDSSRASESTTETQDTILEAHRVQCAESTLSSQYHEMEGTVARLQRELSEAQGRLVEHDACAKKTIMTMQNEMRARLENLGRLCEDNRKEKESMVLKYAQAEQKTLETHKRVRELEGRLREAQREKEGLTKQSRAFRQEKDRLQGIYEKKCTEMAALEKELIGSKDTVNTADMKVKWHQNKLKEETDRHKETKRKLDDTVKALNNAKEETETIRANCQQIVKQYQEAEDIRSNSLGAQLKQKENELKQTQAENYVQQEVHQKALKDLEQARKVAREATGELRTLRDKVKCLEAERMCQEEAASQAKERALRMKAQRDQLAERARALEGSASEAGERLAQLEECRRELEAAREARADLEADAESARARETELLEFTQRLSDRNAALQAENLTQRTSLDEQHAKLSALGTQLDAAQRTVEEQRRRLEEQQSAHSARADELSQALAEKTRLGEELSVLLADERNEIRTLKKKHAANTKDLTRQLAALQRKVDKHNSPLGGLTLGGGTAGAGQNSAGEQRSEMAGHQPEPPSAHHLHLHHHQQHSQTSNGDALHLHTSPTSSTSSLDLPAAYPHTAAGGMHMGTAVSVDGGPGYGGGVDSGAGSSMLDPALSATPEIKMIMPDRQALIDKIVRLQRQNARHNEKMDFLQEHVAQLTEQLKRKNRLLQHFILREEAGSVTPEDFDLNKAALARKGGIMASVYSSHASDQGMTLDLSLEITRKLQAVLEDTLLKNITLKDNLNTLGEEISRLSRENREMKLNSQSPS